MSSTETFRAPANSLSIWREFYLKNQEQLRKCHAGLPWQTIENFVSDPWNRECRASTDSLQQRLLAGEPIQQCFECAYFYGLRFYVNQHCLIPRPETEGLVELTLDTLNKQFGNIALKGIDVGTGSGAIALALLSQRKRLQMMGTDLSSNALQVAKRNAEISRLKLELRLGDRLSFIESQDVDFIVSNPPHIPRSSVNQVQEQVHQFEPEDALYLEDREYRTWFKQFFKQMSNVLREEGLAFLEGHEGHLEELAELGEQLGLKSEVKKDLAGKLRYLILQKRKV